MTKSLTIKIGDQLFEIEQNAYDMLSNYIDSLQAHFKNDPDSKDIVEDIEMRIAELFTELQTPEFKIVRKEEVEFIKLKMGTVNEFDPVEDMYALENETEEAPHATTQVAKKLMRDPDDRVLGGVCSGLGHYFNINPIVLRIILLALFFGLGLGLFVYLLMWIIVPKANSTTDKLMMKGQPINLNTVADSVKEELRQHEKTGSSLLNFLGDIFYYFARFLFAIAKVLLIIISIVLLFTAITSIIASAIGLIKGGVLVQSLSVGTGPVFWLMKMLLLTALGIPVLLLVVVLIYLLLNRNYFKTSFVLPLLGLWIISVVCLSLYGSRIAADFNEESTIKDTYKLDSFSSDTLVLSILKSDVPHIDTWDRNFNIITGNFLQVKDKLYIDGVNLKIKASTTNQFQLIVEQSAKGKNKDAAVKRASETGYVWKQDNDQLLLEPFYSLKKNIRWRKQQVSLILLVPQDKFIKLGGDMDLILEDIDNVHNMAERNMIDHIWQMQASGFTCISCDIEYEEVTQNQSQQIKKLLNSNIGYFTDIELTGAFKVGIKQGDHTEILFNGSTELPRNIELIEDKAKRKLSMIAQNKVKKVDVEITIPNLNQIDFEGAGELKIDEFNTNEFSLNVEGLIASDIELNCNILNLQVEGAASHTLKGIATNANIQVEGVSRIKASKLKIDIADIKMEGANSASFWVKDELDISLEGANSVSYKGNPTVDKNLSFGSSLSQK